MRRRSEVEVWGLHAKATQGLHVHPVNGSLQGVYAYVIYKLLGAGEPVRRGRTEERKGFHIRALCVNDREEKGLFGRHGALARYRFPGSYACKEEHRA